MPSLYMTQPGSRLELEAGRLLCTLGDDVLLAVSSARVDQVIVVGGCNVTTPALAFLLDRGIGLIFLSAGGTIRGRLESGDSGQAGRLAVRRAQYRRADDPAFCLALGKAIVGGKIRNCRTRCMELDQTGAGPAVTAITRLREALGEIEEAGDLATLMGIEGRADRWYFGVLRQHLRSPWTFPGRVRRPPPDPVNALLSLVYTLLHEHCRAALAAAGLDPALGFLHQPRSGRASLALDLMEEFRPVIADPVVWTLLNKRILSPADFTVNRPEGGVRLTPEGWRAVAEQYAHRLETGIRVPGRTTRTTYRKLLEVQARQVRRVIEGEQGCYEPFLSK